MRGHSRPVSAPKSVDNDRDRERSAKGCGDGDGVIWQADQPDEAREQGVSHYFYMQGIFAFKYAQLRFLDAAVNEQHVFRAKVS